MKSWSRAALALCLLQVAVGIKVKMVMHTEEESGGDDDAAPPAPAHEPRGEAWEPKEADDAPMPFIKTRKHKPKMPEYEEERTTAVTTPAPTVPPKHSHPNEMFFPLIYKQTHINSLFKFEGNWYTWSIEKHPDGTKITNFYYCNDEPKHCDDIGWEHIDAPPKCAFQIDSLTYDDRACTSAFGVPRRALGGVCNGADQTKVNDIVKSCGSRIRSLWKFARSGRRAPAASKPADVNSLICEDEDECYVTVEYRIHHDRITFSLHEPTRGQTFKSALKRDQLGEEPPATKPPPAPRHKPVEHKKHARTKVKSEGKGVAKERNDSAYSFRRPAKTRNRINDDVSDGSASE